MTSTLNAFRYKGNNHTIESAVVILGTSNRKGFFFFQGYEVCLDELLGELEHLDRDLIRAVEIKQEESYCLSA